MKSEKDKLSKTQIINVKSHEYKKELKNSSSNLMSKTFNHSLSEIEHENLKLRDYSFERKKLKLNKLAYRSNSNQNELNKLNR